MHSHENKKEHKKPILNQSTANAVTLVRIKEICSFIK